MKTTMEMFSEAIQLLQRETRANETRIRCNNTHCDCYKYGNCSSDSLSIMWNDKRNNFEFTCDFKR